MTRHSLRSCACASVLAVPSWMHHPRPIGASSRPIGADSRFPVFSQEWTSTFISAEISIFVNVLVLITLLKLASWVKMVWFQKKMKAYYTFSFRQIHEKPDFRRDEPLHSYLRKSLFSWILSATFFATARALFCCDTLRQSIVPRGVGACDTLRRFVLTNRSSKRKLSDMLEWRLSQHIATSVNVLECERYCKQIKH